MPKPTADRPRLSFAVLTRDPVAAWQASAVDALAAVDGLSITRWLVDRTAASATPPRSGALAVGSTSALDGLTPEPIQTAEPQPEDARCVDVLLDLSGGVAPAVPWAKEIWRFRYGRHWQADPIQAALTAAARTPGRTFVALVSEPAGRVLREGRLAWWRGEQLDRILLDPSGWPATAALDLVDGPSGRTDGSVDAGVGPPLEASRPLPNALLAGMSVARRLTSALVATIHHDDWHVGIVDAPIEGVAASGELAGVRWLPAPPGKFAADPFGVEVGASTHIFFEDYDQAEARGTIAHVELRADGTLSDQVRVLDPGVHASYPFVVEDSGSIFLLPETAAAGRLTLYECVEFPFRWQAAATLIEEPVVDGTVVHFEGRWWLFGTRLDRGANHNLFLWHAPALTGPWTPHEANPVKTDSRSARPGGTPFIMDGRLHRPSQDDEMGYGTRVVINEVHLLTPRRFVERPVGTVAPPPGSPYPDGLHTLSRVGHRTLIDGNRRRFVRETFRRDTAARARSLRRRRG